MAKSGNENERGQKLEGMYNTFMGDVSQLFPKTDSNLLLNVMALERKFPDMMPHVHLEIGKHTSELQSHHDLVCRLLLEKKNKHQKKKKHNKIRATYT